MGTLSTKVAVVSGSGRGIGREIALKLAGEGARVVVNDLDPEPANDTVAEIIRAGGEAVTCIGDVTDIDFGDRFVRTAVDEFGALDIIVNNAGYTWDTVIQKMTDEQWQAILDVHLMAPFRILRAAQPVISRLAREEAPSGQPRSRRVINVSSIAGLGGNPGQANYASAKAGVIGLTKTLAKEWGRYNVTVNAVAFGVIETRLTVASADADSRIDIGGNSIKVGMSAELMGATEQLIPLRRAGTPAEAAGSVYLLCLPEADYISGQVVVCGGGISI